MNWGHSSGDRGTWFYIRDRAIDAPVFLVGLACLSMLVTLAAGWSGRAFLEAVEYAPADIWLKWQWWRVGTYAFYNPPSFSFVVQLLAIWWMGRTLDSFLGRRVLFKLVAGCILAPALVGIVVGLFVPVKMLGLNLGLGLFVAFATMSPGMPMMFDLTAKVVAWLVVGLGVLLGLSQKNVWEVAQLLSLAGFAHGLVRYELGTLGFSWDGLFSALLSGGQRGGGRPNLRVFDPSQEQEQEQLRRKERGMARGGTKDFGGEVAVSERIEFYRVAELIPEGQDVVLGENEAKDQEAEEENALAKVDRLLEKIAKTGMVSLTSEEKDQLLNAREVLLRREQEKRARV